MNPFFRSKRTAIVGCAAGAAVLAAVGLGGAAFADGGPTGPSTSASQAPSAPAAPSGAPASPPAGGPAGKHAPHIGGTVRTVDGGTVTVQDPDGFTRTIRLAGDATVTKDGAKSSTSAIVNGVWIDATGTVDSNGTTLDATAVTIGRPTPPKGGPAGPGAAAPIPPKGGAERGAPAAPDASSAPSAPTTAPTGS